MQYNLINSMKSSTIKLIQSHIKILTNSFISQYEIKNYILPIIEYINNSSCNKFLISGSQGVGKTTLLKIIELILKKKFNKKILSLSLDDFYFDKRKRSKIAQNIHPLLKTRGVPGTHDISYLLKIINRFDKSKYPIKLPVFDKISDSLKRKERIIKNKCDILILEGWCVGCPPIHKNFLFSNINTLEKKFDIDGRWRKYYNHQLKTNYLHLFKKFDLLIYLKIPSFAHVLNWRVKQEKYLLKKNTNIQYSGMSKKEIAMFIQYYEKITKWMFKVMPNLADIVLYINQNQKILRIKEN